MGNKHGIGGFKKGQSGNPGGRPKRKQGSFADQIRLHTTNFLELLRIALRIARNPRVDANDRMSAVRWLADRGLGKVPEGGEVPGVGDTPAVPLKVMPWKQAQ